MTTKKRESLGVTEEQYTRLRQLIYNVVETTLSDEEILKRFYILNAKEKLDLIAKLIPFVLTKPDSIHTRDIVDREVEDLKLNGYENLFETQEQYEKRTGRKIAKIKKK